MTSIIPLNNENAAAVGELARRIWPTAYAGILTPRQIDNMLTRIYSETALQREMDAGHRFWGAYDDEQFSGFASAYKEADAIWLKKLYVLPAKQRQGLGKLLIRTAVKALSPANELKLLVNRKNIPGIRFYERSGFTMAGEEPVQMGDFKFVDLIFSKKL